MVENAIENINEIVKIQRKSIRTRIVYAVILFVTGAIALIAIQMTQVFDEGPYLKEAMSAVSGLLSSFSAFPIKEVMDRTASIRIFILFESQLDKLARKLNGNPGDPTATEEMENITNLVWEKIKNIALT